MFNKLFWFTVLLSIVGCAKSNYENKSKNSSGLEGNTRYPINEPLKQNATAREVKQKKTLGLNELSNLTKKFGDGAETSPSNESVPIEGSDPTNNQKLKDEILRSESSEPKQVPKVKIELVLSKEKTKDVKTIEASAVNEDALPALNDTSALVNPKMEEIVPQKPSPNIKAPSKFNHPLDDATNLIFMLGEDESGYYLYGEGALLTGAYDKFLKYVNFYSQQNIELNRLMLHSPGGIVNEGLKIGYYLRENKWITDSDKYMKCYSTCGFVFASGVEKRIQGGAEVGFHRPYLVNEADTQEFIQQVYQDYLPFWNYIQGDQKLYHDFMTNYGRDDMLILDTKTIKQYMVVEFY